MIRRDAFINNKILNIYKQLPRISFPLDLKQVIDLIPNCKYMSYQEFAKINNCSVSDVIQICESQSGCTHYDILNDRYLILCNQSTENNNNIGRQRWTLGHEIGHVVCNHLAISAFDKLAENSLSTISNQEYESEADHFSATMLAPFPLFKILNITSPVDIQNIFGLSSQASYNRYNQYLKWKDTRYKTAWENNMIKLYQLKHY